MKIATVYSACECQARLGADLDVQRVVTRGWAADARRGEELVSPAHSIAPERPRFDIGWMCPFCTRNVLRSFDTANLVYKETLIAG
ncbi:MAG TPA: hypothetical protein VER33_25525 [Polyangiaceae bacterium]|nr:hypothetical protein [Polyangiaceae bacterium]